MKTQNPIDDLFRQGLSDYKVPPSKDRREAFLNEASGSASRHLRWIFWIAGLVVIVGTVVFFVTRQMGKDYQVGSSKSEVRSPKYEARSQEISPKDEGRSPKPEVRLTEEATRIQEARSEKREAKIQQPSSSIQQPQPTSATRSIAQTNDLQPKTATQSVARTIDLKPKTATQSVAPTNNAAQPHTNSPASKPVTLASSSKPASQAPGAGEKLNENQNQARSPKPEGRSEEPSPKPEVRMTKVASSIPQPQPMTATQAVASTNDAAKPQTNDQQPTTATRSAAPTNDAAKPQTNNQQPTTATQAVASTNDAAKPQTNDQQPITATRSVAPTNDAAKPQTNDQQPTTATRSVAPTNEAAKPQSSKGGSYESQKGANEGGVNPNRKWNIQASAYYNPEWLFNTLNGDKFVNNAGLEGTFRFGPYSVRTGVGLSITTGSNEVVVQSNAYLGSYNALDSIVFHWDEQGYYLIPTYYTTGKQVFDTALKYNYTYNKKRYTYLQVPLMLGYDFYRNNWLSLGIRAGTVMSVLLKSETLGDTYDPGKDKIITINNVSPDRVALNWQAVGGINANFRLSRRFSLELEPQLRYYFNSVYETSEISTKPWSVGLRAAFTITF